MISVRDSIFESNSSSLHALTVPVKIEDTEYVKKGVNEILKKQKSKNKIVIELKDNSEYEGGFTIRHYIPHYSIHDKILYVVATIVQHYSHQLYSGPYKPYKYSFEKDDTGLNARMARYEEELAEWKAKSVHDTNALIIKDFKNEIRNLEEGLSRVFREALYGKPPADYYFDEDGRYHKIDPKDIKPDTRPEFKVVIKYYISEEDSIRYSEDPEAWFSTGCYGNEEFYETLQSIWNGAIDWICNPYAAVLAGGDEQDEEDSVAQLTEAKRLIDESWEVYKKKNDTYDSDLILNRGKVVFPIGG